MLKSILVASDGSHASRHALEWAINKAVHENASVTLAYVIDDSFFAETPVFISEARTAADSLIKTELEYAKNISSSVDYNTKVCFGNLAHEVQEMSKSFDLVVIAHSDKNHISSRILGTKAVRVAALSHAPVIVIPEGNFISGPVLACIDTSPASKIIVEAAAAEADRNNTDLIALYAWHAPVTPGLEYIWADEIVQTQEDLAESSLSIALAGISNKYPDLKIHKKIVQQNPVDAIINEAKNSSLIVMGNRGRSTVSRLLLGSVSHSVLLHSHAPTLVVKTSSH